ncbi:phosphopantothenoylcysteine decarboxylase [Nodularia spumigena]|uniref:phosphopantothenoylcysteine decarboxylase n=1 Tax=Nodularia spumigena TaxID=70799 RepID=UPI002B1F445F|nr:phosphopantothenoylcysteine decarboxylase [Nodularia spumigena]MEA5614861.1 phosphopantothenoylcysteine decarboxylase [Nodularia spumigena UHCC 0040]
MTQTSPNLHLLVTAGPTYEPIDAVRFIGNRSSGRLGSALADEATRRGWTVTLLLGPNAIAPSDPRVRLVRFQSTADLQARLAEFLPHCDVLVMAAAVADYRPAPEEIDPLGKRRRSKEGMTLRLEATPDLLSGCSSQARPDQLLVGFALEPQAQLMDSARAKLARKSIDLIVANPLETMDSSTIRAWLIGNADRGISLEVSTGEAIPKDCFAAWLLDHLTPLAHERAASERARVQP